MVFGFGFCFVASLGFLGALADQFISVTAGHSMMTLFGTGIGSIVGLGFFVACKIALKKDAERLRILLVKNDPTF
jgi:altronate dehydratase